MGYGFEEPARQPPFYFSVRVPEEGNYKVTATLGDPANDSVTTIKAELRRLMLERVRVAAGKMETRSFLVNVRTPKDSGRQRSAAERSREDHRSARLGRPNHEIGRASCRERV